MSVLFTLNENRILMRDSLLKRRYEVQVHLTTADAHLTGETILSVGHAWDDEKARKGKEVLRRR